MHTEELEFLPAAPPEPSPDLWQRIERAHTARRTRRLRLRIGAAATFACAAFGTYLLLPAGAPDWQARSQALEIELRNLPARPDTENAASLETESQLAQLDTALQAAYDRGATPKELIALWKQRSELLSTLLTVRQVAVAVTRI